MKVLVYSASPQSPHLETDLELAKRLSTQGHEVVFLRCKGILRVCVENPFHQAVICAACRSKYEKAIELTKLDGVRFVALQEEGDYSTIPAKFANVDELKNFTYEGHSAGQAVASTLIGRINKDHKFSTEKYSTRVNRALKTWVDAYTNLKKFIDEWNPDEVYFFNGRFLTHHPLMSLAVQKNITWYTHERGGTMNTFILRKNAMPHDIEYSIAEVKDLWKNAGRDREAIGHRFYVDRRNNVAQSWVSFTKGQEQGQLPAGFDHSKKNVVIFNSTMEEYEGMPSWKNPIYKDDNDGLRRVIESLYDRPDFEIYLRVHPNLKLLENSQVKEIREMAAKYPRVKVIWPEETVHSYALLDHAFKVITLGSTIGVEATYWGKPSILLGKAMYLGIDACYEPPTHEEAVQLILQPDLAPKSQLPALMYGYWELTKGEPFEWFTPIDLFTMSAQGQTIQPSKALAFLHKVSKLRHIHSRRDLDVVVNKIRGLIR